MFCAMVTLVMFYFHLLKHFNSVVTILDVFHVSVYLRSKNKVTIWSLCKVSFKKKKKSLMG